MFLVEIANPENEKEYFHYTISGDHPCGEILRKALWAVGREYVIKFYPTHIYIGMEEAAKRAEKVTVSKLLSIYSKIKFYKKVKKTKQVTKEVTKLSCMKYPKESIILNLSTTVNRCFLRFSPATSFITVNDIAFINAMNKALGTNFMWGTECWHYALTEGEDIQVDEAKGIITRKSKEIVIVSEDYYTTELI